MAVLTQRLKPQAYKSRACLLQAGDKATSARLQKACRQRASFTLLTGPDCTDLMSITKIEENKIEIKYRYLYIKI